MDTNHCSGALRGGKRGRKHGDCVVSVRARERYSSSMSVSRSIKFVRTTIRTAERQRFREKEGHVILKGDPSTSRRTPSARERNKGRKHSEVAMSTHAPAAAVSAQQRRKTKRGTSHTHTRTLAKMSSNVTPFPQPRCRKTAAHQEKRTGVRGISDEQNEQKKVREKKKRPTRVHNNLRKIITRNDEDGLGGSPACKGCQARYVPAV